MRLKLHFAIVLAVVFFSAPTYAAEETPLTEAMASLGNLGESSFHVRQILHVYLDGSETASSIQRNSETRNEVIFFNFQKWRARRELLFTNAMRELLKNGDIISWVTPTNRPIDPPEPTSDLPMLEILLSPLRLAQSWNLADLNVTLSDWLENLSQLKEPVKNVEGDFVQFEKLLTGLRLSFKGKVIQDTKTQVQVNGSWELTNQGKVQESDLNHSLMGSP